MGKVYLCGHTGSENHGAEAIVRSTARLLGESGHAGIPVLATFNEVQDLEFDLDRVVDLLPYSPYPSTLTRYISAIRRKISRSYMPGQHLVQGSLWSTIEPGDICLNIGGDTYCYGTPVPSLALNEAMQKAGVPSVLWCCSLEKTGLTPTILADLKRYRYLVPREKLTYDLLIEAGFAAENILRCCDPAFHLEAVEVSLPHGFVEGSTVGINLSDLVMSPRETDDMTRKNVLNLIEYMISETNMQVCLIPHGYSAERHTGDIVVLEELYEAFRHTGRVCIVDKDHNCEQLKYIISKCRFFIGARTHATIAAYSSGVPAIALGYSIKSKGIATDLFGTYGGYVLPYDCLSSEGDLLTAFKAVETHEEQIIAQYRTILPGYKRTVSAALARVIGELL